VNENEKKILIKITGTVDSKFLILLLETLQMEYEFIQIEVASITAK